LQVERKEEGLRLSCRWLGDLTQADEAMIEACDRAYDRAKMQTTKFAKNKGGGATQDYSKESKSMKPPSLSVKEPTFLSLSLNTPHVRLSHILQLKALFAQHRGSTPVKIDFVVENGHYAAIHIDSPWGVVVSEALQVALKEISSVTAVAVNTS
jgi:DNA polymerase-3 subunit alpha